MATTVQDLKDRLARMSADERAALLHDIAGAPAPAEVLEDLVVDESEEPAECAACAVAIAAVSAIVKELHRVHQPR